MYLINPPEYLKDEFRFFAFYQLESSFAIISCDAVVIEVFRKYMTEVSTNDIYIYPITVDKLEELREFRETPFRQLEKIKFNFDDCSFTSEKDVKLCFGIEDSFYAKFLIPNSETVVEFNVPFNITTVDRWLIDHKNEYTSLFVGNVVHNKNPVFDFAKKAQICFGGHIHDLNLYTSDLRNSVKMFPMISVLYVPNNILEETKTFLKSHYFYV
jgi:hypothetical protein